MKAKARRCVICGELGTEKWTLTKGPDLIVADLCLEHSQPFHDTVQGVLKQQAAEKKPVLAADLTVPPGKSPRGMSFEPLNWTPPAE